MGMMGNERGLRGRQTERHSQGEKQGGELKKEKRGAGRAYRKRETQSRVRTFFFSLPTLRTESRRIDGGESA